MTEVIEMSMFDLMGQCFIDSSVDDLPSNASCQTIPPKLKEASSQMDMKDEESESYESSQYQSLKEQLSEDESQNPYFVRSEQSSEDESHFRIWCRFTESRTPTRNHCSRVNLEPEATDVKMI
jgi:hypothetical protein